jgi:ubiquitin-conjugating enzyme E2 M
LKFRVRGVRVAVAAEKLPKDMIKLSSVKEKKQKEEEDAKAGKKQESPAEIRLSKDFAELSLPPKAELRFPHGNSVLSRFELDILPDEGYFTGGRFTFTLSVPSNYPYEPPKA